MFEGPFGLTPDLAKNQIEATLPVAIAREADDRLRPVSKRLHPRQAGGVHAWADASHGIVRLGIRRGAVEQRRRVSHRAMEMVAPGLPRQRLDVRSAVARACLV